MLVYLRALQPLAATPADTPTAAFGDGCGKNLHTDFIMKLWLVLSL